MAEVIRNLDSLEKTRPHFSAFLMTDSNPGGKVAQIHQNRKIRSIMKFPSLRVRQEMKPVEADPQLSGYKKWNDEGEHRALAPCRSHDNLVDPVSGFVSTGGAVKQETGHGQIGSMVQLNDTPQSSTPQSRHSIRTNEPAAYPELKRNNTWAPGRPTAWNSRKTSEAWIRSQLGGWTSKFDPRKSPPELSRSKSMYAARSPSEKSKQSRDALALKFVYCSSTQRGYEEVPWDSMLHPKKWPPTTTLELRPDMVSFTFNKPCEPGGQTWQSVGRDWDRLQMRKGNYKTRPVAFSSPCPRVKQIPLYGGSIGAKNLEEKDNTEENFQPFTVKRGTIPRPSEISHRPNIPGYKGCTQWQGDYKPANAAASGDNPYSQSVTAAVHRPMPLPEKEIKREADMSRMITLVPPCNPFNRIEKEEIVVA